MGLIVGGEDDWAPRNPEPLGWKTLVDAVGMILLTLVIFFLFYKLFWG